MKLRHYRWLAGALSLALVTAYSVARQDNQPPPRPPEDALPQDSTTPPAGVEVQTRGPLHEAYAEPNEARPLPSPLVAKEPPPPIDEVPPDEKPEGDNVVWIPGYWSHDDDRADYVWVSGFWRVPPPGRQWVPGSWQEVDGGWHWVPGYWQAADQEETEYLPAPPPSVDYGPSTLEPDEASDYVPGCWIFRDARYRWRPGFWLAHRPGWTWVPARYLWTTVGYLFVEGYWDRPLLDRGLLFAPVYCDQAVVRAAGFRFVPSFVVSPDFLLGALFVRPANCHYYFGDYFEDRYTARGFVPWIDYRIGRSAPDPNFAWYRREFAHEPRWERSLHALYAARLDGSVPRPPRTLLQQRQLVTGLTANHDANVAVSKTINFTNAQNVTALTPLSRINNVRVTGLAVLALAPGERRTEPVRTAAKVVHLARLAGDERERLQRATAAVRDVARRRVENEARLLREGEPKSGAPRVVKVERPKNEPPPVARPAQPEPTPPVRRPEPQPAPRPEPQPAPRSEPRPQPPAGERATPPIERVPPRPAAPSAHAPLPPPPMLPKHEDRPIPQHEPPKQPRPPAPRPAPPPPKKEAPAPPKK
jgi:hypothetical protein